MPKSQFKTPKRFRLMFVNDNTFNSVWEIKMSQTRVVISIIAIIVAIIGILTALFMYTPIRTLLPGYLEGDLRQQYQNATMRIDSLTTSMNIHNAYLDNIVDIMNDDIDTATVKHQALTSTTSIDSIIGASEQENQFARQFKERERFNISVLSPIAAEGMTFFPPAKDVKTSSSNDGVTLTLTTTSDTPISATYRGIVIDCYHTLENGYTIIIQHPNNFISRYSGLSTSFTRKGATVNTSSRIGMTYQSSYPITFELWHNGTPINPTNYVAF